MPKLIGQKLTQMQSLFDLGEYLSLVSVCFFWGFLMGMILGFDSYTIVVLSLIAVLLACVWGGTNNG